MQSTSPRLAVALVEELIASGMRDVVLAPGSRSAPIALALADAERRGHVRLHVRIDERSAAYLALGLARVSGDPVAVITTSGTAAVNLHPAVVEAAYAGVPLIAVTADRPGSMRGTGANQTIDQRELFGSDVRAFVDVESLDEPGLREVVANAVSAALEPHRGPLHINVPLAEPLVAPDEHAVADVTRRGRHPRVRAGAPVASLLPGDLTGVSLARGIVIAGDFEDEVQRKRATELATVMGWPVLSEPSGNLSAHPNSLRHGPLILASPRSRELQADVVVTVGRVGLHRPVTRLLRDARVHIAVDVPPHLGRVDPAQTAHVIVDAVPVGDGTIDPDWLAAWRQADEAAANAVTDALSSGGTSSGGSRLSGPLVARIVGEAAHDGDLLVVGPSWPVRHLSSYGGRLRARCLGNRGTSGIDGVMSTGWGAAVAHGDRHPDATTYVLVGDLTAIYDRNALLVPASEARPRLVYVVADNGGGGIFSALEQGAPEFGRDFERVFGTPLDADVATLLAAPGVDVVCASTQDDLRDRLAARHDGVSVIVARCASRADEAGIVRSVQAAVDRTLN